MSRAAVASWSPARLPAIRDQTSRLLRDPHSPIHAALADDPPAGEALVRQGHHLLASDLYWVTAQMSALAVSSAASLSEVRWTAADRPSHFGLLVWHEGIGSVDYQGAAIPVTAMSWAPDPDGLAVCCYLSRRALAQRFVDRGLALANVDQIPQLVPTWGSAYPTHADWTPADELGDWRTPLTVLYATWALMQQPTIAGRSRPEVDRSIQRSYRRAERPEPEVTLVDLRRQYVPTGPVESDEASRTYRHRWVVQGHWRDQPYGPGRAERRKQWIASHVKGPDGAPLLETARVNVWRR